MASFIWSTLQMGTLNTAPALVFTVSPFTGAPPFFWIIIPSTPVHSAVLIIAPKFLTSLNWSKSKNKGSFLVSMVSEINCSKS